MLSLEHETHRGDVTKDRWCRYGIRFSTDLSVKDRKARGQCFLLAQEYYPCRRPAQMTAFSYGRAQHVAP
jgi:hypothetical protein